MYGVSMQFEGRIVVSLRIKADLFKMAQSVGGID